MDWSPQQEQALAEVARWLKTRDKQVFRLFGYAGTGKTTLARHLAEGIDGEVAFGAFTGGLNVCDAAFARCFGRVPDALVMGREKVWPVAGARCVGDG